MTERGASYNVKTQQRNNTLLVVGRRQHQYIATSHSAEPPSQPTRKVSVRMLLY